MNEKKNNIYASPKAQGQIAQPSVVYAHKDKIVIDEAPIFPKRCHICNAPSESAIKIKLRYYPPYIYLPILLFLTGHWFVDILGLPIKTFSIICIAVTFFTGARMLMKRKTICFELPICELHQQRRKIAFLGTLLCCVATVAAWFIAFSEQKFGIAIIVSIICFFVFSLLDMMRPYARIVFAGDERYWLRGTGKAFRDSLPDL